MPRLLFGFQFGAPGSSTSSVAPVVVPTTDPWSKLALFSEVWRTSRDTALFPRFERVFPHLTPVYTQATLGSIVSLTYRVSSQFPFVIATDTKVLIASNLTMIP